MELFGTDFVRLEFISMEDLYGVFRTVPYYDYYGLTLLSRVRAMLCYATTRLFCIITL